MDIEVAYADEEIQVVLPLSMSPGATVADALQLAFDDPRLQKLCGRDHAVGIYGQLCERQQVLQSGDRVEIYRELPVDAKTARRKRASEQGFSAKHRK